MAKRKQIINNRYGKLVVAEFYGKSKAGNLIYSCLCDCGNSIQVLSGNLLAGRTRSCGCTLHKNRILNTHGKTHPLYNIWSGMMSRCYNTKSPSFKYYGAKGIAVILDWHSFDQFITDMSPRPNKSYTLDRIDNTGDYSLVNCRWATRELQGSNRSNSVNCTLKGITRPRQEWVWELNKLTGFSNDTIRKRIMRGWAYEDIINKPLQKQCRS